MSKKPLVIVLHGIYRTSMSMALFDVALRWNGYDVLNITYPSLRHNLDRLSEITAAKIRKSKKIDQAEDIYFVTHSMGGLICRYLLSHQPDLQAKTRSVVMLVPPNRGSEMADFAHNTGWLKSAYRFFFGPAGQQMITEYAVNYPDLDCHVGIITGSRSAYPMSRLVFDKETPHDGLISHDRMKLNDNSVLFNVRTSHTAILCNPTAIKATLRFLKTGQFAASA